MTKEDHEKRVATPGQRQLADTIRVSRKNARQWAEVETNAKEDLRGSVGGLTDIVLETSSGEEVANITEALVKGRMDWDAFMADHPGLDYDKYRKPASTSVTIRTQWVEAEKGN